MGVDMGVAEALGAEALMLGVGAGAAGDESGVGAGCARRWSESGVMG